MPTNRRTSHISHYMSLCKKPSAQIMFIIRTYCFGLGPLPNSIRWYSPECRSSGSWFGVYWSEHSSSTSMHMHCRKGGFPARALRWCRSSGQTHVCVKLKHFQLKTRCKSNPPCHRSGMPNFRGSKNYSNEGIHRLSRQWYLLTALCPLRPFRANTTGCRSLMTLCRLNFRSIVVNTTKTMQVKQNGYRMRWQ